jgi:UrcA family protein
MNCCLAFISAIQLTSLGVSSVSIADPVGPGVKLVRYDDPDLSTPSGMKEIRLRIEDALNEVCLDPNGPAPAGTVNIVCKATRAPRGPCSSRDGGWPARSEAGDRHDAASERAHGVSTGPGPKGRAGAVERGP